METSDFGPRLFGLNEPAKNVILGEIKISPL